MGLLLVVLVDNLLIPLRFSDSKKLSPTSSDNVRMLALKDVIFRGPALTARDELLLQTLPAELAAVLRQENGFIAFNGGLHVRGLCAEPAWHSLLVAMQGHTAIHELFVSVRPTDIPFGEDCVGDQFILREGGVFILDGEQDRLQSTGLSLDAFFAEAARDPVNFLAMDPLLRLRREGRDLDAGTLVNVHPPFVFDYRGERTVKAVPAPDRLSFLSALAHRVQAGNVQLLVR